jgi:hypothetical protein
MSYVQRLRLIGIAGLALAGIITCTQVWGDAAGSRPSPIQPLGRKDTGPHELKAGESLAAARFAEQPVVSYMNRKGETIFGAQIRPDLGAAVEQSRDVLVLVDTSASQAGAPYASAREILKSLSTSLKDGDRLSVWTVNIPEATKGLTNGFQAPRGDKVTAALTRLEKDEYCSGAGDLKGALTKALKEFDGRADRQQVVLLLGDGESAYAPLANAERYQIAQEMVGQKIAFFAVPLGMQLNPMNLHGLASSTGGSVVRLEDGVKIADLTKSLMKTVAAPILYPAEFELAKGVVEAYPTKLPPLRPDTATLMVGKLSEGDAFSLTIKGTIAGRETKVEVREKIAKPEIENYFLTGMLSQWSKASNKGAPALIRADRALAYAYQQTKFTHDEYMTQAHWALSEERIEAAEKLFALASQVDPHDKQAVDGLAVVQRLKDHELSRERLKSEVEAAKDRAAQKVAQGQIEQADDRIDLQKLLMVKADSEQQPPAGGAAPPPAGGAAPPPGNADLLQMEQQQRRLAEQQVTESVDRTIKNAKTMLNTDPDGAYNLLKRQMESVVNAGVINEKTRGTLVNRLEGQMRDFELRGREIKLRIQEEESRRIAAARAAAAKEIQASLVERTRERIRAFTNLMDKARYEEAYKEANLLREESINSGQPVPIQATASYMISLNSMNLKELNELKRIREERFLLTMMQVEKSHVPYPDEPPVHFPPAAAWKELTKLRSKRYGYYSFGPAAGENYTKVVARMNSPMRPGIEQATELPLSSWLEQFRQNLEGTNFYIRPNEESLKADPPVRLFGDESPRVKIPAMPGATLGSVMAQVLSQLGLTYFVNQDHVEIIKKAHAKKSVNHALRVYEVADLIIPIPSALNTFGVGQTLSVIGGAASFGSAGSPFNAFGNNVIGIAGIGGLGGLGAIGGLGGGIGGLGGLGGLGGGLGGLGGGLGLGGGAGGGQLGINGAGGLAGQGGLLGFGGGQAGQLGNLGGQFGFQGQTFENYLVRLIRDTIARGKWSALPGYLRFGGTAPQPGMMGDDENTELTPVDEQYDIGFYPPALALVVRAPSHYRPYVKDPNAPATDAGAGGMGQLLPKGRGNAMLAKNDANFAPAGKNDPGVGRSLPKTDPKALAEWESSKPRKLVTAKEWEDALAADDIKPEHRVRMFIAAVKFLGEVKQFDAVANIIRGAIRRGICNDPWMYDALALALKDGGSSEELRRANLSAIDLDPKDSESYLKAAKTMADAGDNSKAVSFCRIAAELKPGSADPYANALAYASKAKSVDIDTVHWAVTNLLGRDWVIDKDTYYEQAKSALADAKSRLLSEKRGNEAQQLEQAIARQQRRDLVVELNWNPQSPCDLDLSVVEPIGTTCSATQRQTPAGSMLVCDDLSKRQESYTVAEAYSGTYIVRVNRVWGRPLNGTAQLKVVRHQGTDEQVIEYHTVSVDQPAEIKVSLANGRRKELAAVPPPVAPGHPEREKATNGMAKAIEQLRALADPLYRNDMTVRVGGAGAAVTERREVYDLAHTPMSAAKVSYQTKVEGVDNIAAELVEKVEMDRGKVVVKVTPAFDAVGALKDRPEIINPLIPGGN